MRNSKGAERKVTHYLTTQRQPWLSFWHIFCPECFPHIFSLLSFCVSLSPAPLSPVFYMRIQQKAPIWKRALSRTQTCQLSDLRLPTSTTVRSKYLPFKPPAHGTQLQQLKLRCQGTNFQIILSCDCEANPHEIGFKSCRGSAHQVMLQVQANSRKMRVWSHFFLSVQTLAEPRHRGENQSQLKEIGQGVNQTFLKMSRGLLHVELCPSKIIRWGLNPSTSDCDRIWRQGHFRGDRVKTRSSGWVLN